MQKKKMKKKHHDKALEKILKKLPPNYPVGSLIVNGGLAEVAAFSNVDDGLAYFINAECAVSIYDAKKINGMNFGAAAEVEEPEEEEEA
jgi:hypothetical protein